MISAFRRMLSSLNMSQVFNPYNKF